MVSDSEYADDTALLFCDRPTVERMAPVVNAHFQRWGMDVHEKKPSDTMVSQCLHSPCPKLSSRSRGAYRYKMRQCTYINVNTD